MTQVAEKVSNYYEMIQTRAHVITEKQTRLWSTAVLHTLALNLNRRAKRALSKELPDELANEFNRAFWLANFRNTDLPLSEFRTLVARRGGHSDPQYAGKVITAVFHAIKQMVSSDTSDQVAKALPPEVRDAWQNA